MSWALSELQQSHLEQIEQTGFVKTEVPLLGEIYIRPVVNTAKTIEIESQRINGKLAEYMIMTLVHHCFDGDEKPLFNKADKAAILNETNFETLSALFNVVNDVIDSKGVDVKKL